MRSDLSSIGDLNNYEDDSKASKQGYKCCNTNENLQN